MISVSQLKVLCPNNKDLDALCAVLNKILPEYGIDNKKRVCGFLSQTIHESAQFTALKENLNYSAAGLCSVWPKRFTSAAMAAPYNRNPEKIANLVYCNRLGNGTESSGDGFKYRGVGFLQLTGKDNYSRFAKSIGKTLDETVSYCNTLEGAASSSCWFWSVNKLNQFCDSGDFVTLTKRINGGVVGLKDRQHHYDEAMKVISDDVFSEPAPVVTPVIAAAAIAVVVAEEVAIPDEQAVEKNDSFLDDISDFFSSLF